MAQNQRPDCFRWVFAGIFILGFLIATYPFYVSAINHFIDQQRLTPLARQQQKTSQPSQPNNHSDEVADPFANAAPPQQIALKQQVLGSITVPSIALHTPLFKTTNEVTLTYGATVLKIWIVQLVGLGRIVSLLGTVAWLQECYLPILIGLSQGIL